MHTKKGIYYTKAKGIVRHSGLNPPWSLVIGAGASYPIFPSWGDLIRRMYHDVYGTVKNEEIEHVISTFPLDSILQSLKNFSNLRDIDFVSKLSETLYSNLWNSFSIKEREVIFKVLSSPAPGSWGDLVWEAFFVILKDSYRNETFYKISEVLLRAYRNGLMPQSIISFNAESLLLATLTSLIRENYSRNKKHHEKVKQRLDVITRSVSNFSQDRTPFYHIHGHLPVPFINRKLKKSSISIDKLVFSENEYLNLANTSFNWQSSVFLNAAYTNTLVFIGLSFSDLNLRKWLTWTNNNRLNEINQLRPLTINTKHPTQHFWIRVKPKTSLEENLIENNVVHLGVRIIWVDEYSQIADALASIVEI